MYTHQAVHCGCLDPPGFKTEILSHNGPIPEDCFMEMRVKKGPTVFTLFAQSVSTSESIVNCEDFQHSWKASESDSLRDEVCFSKMKGTPLTSEDIGRSEMYWIKVSQRTLIQNERFKTWIQQLRLHWPRWCMETPREIATCWIAGNSQSCLIRNITLLS